LAGNPNKITLFGAVMIGLHLQKWKMRGLFHTAIVQSNPMGVSIS